MTVLRYIAQPVEVDMLCDECGQGFMRPTGVGILSGEFQHWPHRCTKCDAHKNFETAYPYIEWTRGKQL